MKVSINRSEILELTKLAPENVKIYDLSFSNDNTIKLHLDVEFAGYDLKTKIFSFFNNITPRKEVAVRLHKDDNPHALKVTVYRIGCKYLGFLNMLIPQILKIIPKLDIGQEGVNLQGNSLHLNFEQILKETPLLLNFDSIDINNDAIAVTANLEVNH